VIMGCGSSRETEAVRERTSRQLSRSPPPRHQPDEVDCEGQELTELPSIPLDTKMINVASNKLGALPPSVGNLSMLTELDANSNELTALPVELASCESLEALLVFNNKIKELPTTLPPNLTELNLFNNQLKTLPSSIGELANLEEVNVAGNRLMMTTNAMFASWSRVSVLNLYDNNLVRFGSLAPLKALQELRLGENNLEEMPTLGTHPELKILEVHKNRIATIPDGYFNATPALERLSLWGNTLTELPSSVCGCGALLGLQVQENKLSWLPAGAAWPAKLETLFLQHNPLTTLPGELHACKALKRVNVAQTKLGDAGITIAEGMKTTCIRAQGGIFWDPAGVQTKAP